jgi:hypothetical protein
MNESPPTWLPALRALLASLCSPKPGAEGLNQLMTSIADLDSLLSHNRSEMPPDLVHFLDRRSYDKAARYCEGVMTIPRGTCGLKN